MKGQWHEFKPSSVCYFMKLFLLHAYTKAYSVPGLSQFDTELVVAAVVWGAEQRDEAFHHLSLPVILLPLTWSPELAKANYLGQTVSISKHSQQIAFHYWHARQARKLPSTHRDRQSTNGQILIPTRPDATITAVNDRHRACDLSRTKRAKSGKGISNDCPCLRTRLRSPRDHCAKCSQPARLQQWLQVKQSRRYCLLHPKHPSEAARTLGVNQNQSVSDSKRWKMN